MDDSIKANLEVSNHHLESKKEQFSYYGYILEKIGFSSRTWMIFSIANLLQFIWGSEACLIGIYIENLGVSQNIDSLKISLCICLLYSMLGFGSILIGLMSKYLGRIYSLEITTLLYFISISLCSLVTDFYSTIILRCLGNLSIGVFNILVLNLLCEYLPIKSRSFILMFDSGFYNIGNLFVIFLKYIMNDMNKFSISNYKKINFITSLSGLIGFLLLFFFSKESPLFLMSKRRESEAFQILSEMAKSTNLTLSDEDKTKIRDEVISKKNFSLKSNYKELFYNDYRSLTLLCLLLNAICYLNMIGISFLVPKSIKMLNQTKVLSENDQLIIYALIQIPNGYIGGLMTESKLLGRKITILISSIFCFIFYVLVYFHTEGLCYYAGIIMFFNSVAFGCSFIYVSEVFPTNIRDHAQSFIQCLSFILGSWSPLFISQLSQINILSNYIYLGISCILCAIISLVLPIDTYKRPLDEDL